MGSFIRKLDLWVRLSKKMYGAFSAEADLKMLLYKIKSEKGNHRF